MNPHVYGPEHILYLLVYFIFLLSSIILILKITPKERYERLIKSFALINLLLAIWNRLSIYDYHLTLKLIPDSFCSTTGFLSALSILFLKKDSKLIHFVLFAGAFGGILTLIYPDFISQNTSFFYDRTISGLLYHSGMLYLFILTLKLKYFKPKTRNWSVFPLGLCVYVTWGYFGNTVLGQSNNMFLNHNLIEGTIFTWYLVGILITLIYSVFLYLYNRNYTEKQSSPIPESISLKNF